MQSWSRSDSGLIVRSGSSPCQRNANADLEIVKQGRAMRIQAAASMLALLLAIPAVIFSYGALKQQQEINMSQLKLNELQEQRYRNRYSSKVAFWVKVDPGIQGCVHHKDLESARSDNTCNVQVHIENRAPVPLMGLLVIGTDYREWRP